MSENTELSRNKEGVTIVSASTATTTTTMMPTTSTTMPTTVITEQERELAQNALVEFQKGSYSSCITYLNKLETLRPKDVKVMHNKIVAEYYRSELRKTELFGKSLNAICGAATTTPDTPLDAIDDVEKCVMRYNQAILLYHTGQYESALRIIDRLFTFVEPMEEGLARKVSLLLVRLLIVTKRPDAALSIVNYVESQFLSNDAPKLVQHSTLDKDRDKDSVSSLADKSGLTKEKKKEDPSTDAFRTQLIEYKGEIYLMLRQSKLCNNEWKSLVTSENHINLSSVVLKANLECARGNYKKSLKLLNSIMSDKVDSKTYGESAAVIYYNNMACIHRAIEKPNLAAFYLRKALEENERAVKDQSELTSGQSVYTLGCNKHYELMFNLGESLVHAGQPTKAFDCFTEAAQKLHNSPLLWLRMAECCIQCHKSNNGIDFDIAKRREDLVRKVIGTGCHRKIILANALSKDTKYHTESLSYAMPQPTLEFAMLCLKNALLTLPLNEDESSSLPISCPIVTSASATTNVSTMSLGSGLAAAAAAAVAAAAAAASSASASAIPGNGGETILGNAESTSTTKQSTLLPGSSQALDLRFAVLAASAYVSLCLGDYLVAHEYARTMLSYDNIPGAYKMLGNLYAAESAILMDRTNEAIDYLKPQDIHDLDTCLPIIYPSDLSDKDKDRDEDNEENLPKTNKNWFPSSVQTAKAIVKYNLAVAYAIRGEFDKSGEILKQVWLSKGPECDIPIHVIMLALYIELQLGNADVSRSIVKQHCPQYW